MNKELVATAFEHVAQIKAGEEAKARLDALLADLPDSERKALRRLLGLHKTSPMLGRKIQHRRFSEVEDETIRDMLGNGATLLDIAKALGRSKGAINYRMKILGLKPNFRRGGTFIPVRRVA